MSADLADFLRACIDDDERVAKAAITEPFPADKGLGAGVWRQGAPAGHMWAERVEGDDLTIYDEGGHSEAHAAHIARWDPARVLAEVAAKRAIIDEETFAANDGTPNCQGHPGPWLNHGDHGPGYCRDYSDSRILRALVAPFASRAGFDPSWLD